MTKQLIVGTDYGSVFGFTANSGKQMIYLGADLWQAVKDDKTMQSVSPATTAKVLEYINRPTVSMGSM
jgi:hypothetical protein